MNKVLLIDDEAHVISVIKHFLIKAGYSVDIANNGLVGLQKVRKEMPDVVVSDIQMPKMNGQEFCEAFRSEFPESEALVIIMTSRTERDFREWAERMHNIEFMEKPLSPKKLMARLDEYFLIEEVVV